MTISKRDREEYEEGLRDRGRGTIDQGITDLSENHPDSEAYYKGRRGEQLNADKEEQDEED